MKSRLVVDGKSKMAVANGGSRVDTIYRAAIQAPRFFAKGWGDARLLERVFQLLKSSYRPRGNAWINGDNSMMDQYFKICQKSDIKILGSGKNGVADVYEYEFKSPLTKILPGALPKESEKARFQLVIPTKWRAKKTAAGEVPKRRPLCIHLAGTGDHHYWRRRQFMALPLIKEYEIASIIVENPFYGLRKPKGQIRSGLRYVSDLFVMGAALLFEVMTLLDWCEKQGYGPLGVTGISMGGHMASISASGWNKPIGIIPCLSWSTASPVFTQGVMKLSVAWKELEQQLNARPEYATLLERYCKEYAEHLKLQSHNLITDSAYTGQAEVSSKESLIEIITRKSGSPESGLTKLVVENRFKNYDIDKKKLGLFAIDFDSILRSDNLSSNVINTLSEKLSLDTLKQYSFLDDGSIKDASQRTIDYMDFILHEMTHLEKFSPPHKDSQVIFVVANHDNYVPVNGVKSPSEVWPGADIRHIDCGHIMGVLRYQKIFREAVHDALSKL